MCKSIGECLKKFFLNRVVLTSAMIILIIFAFCCFIFLHDRYHYEKPLLPAGLFGLAVFFIILLIANLMSEKKNFSNNEVRRAIAVSVIAVFFLLMSYSHKIDSNDGRTTIIPLERMEDENITGEEISIQNQTIFINESGTLQDYVLEKYWLIVSATILAYFGSRSVEKSVETIANKIGNKKNESEEEPHEDGNPDPGG